MRIFNNTPYTQAEKTAYVSLLAEKLKVEPETISLQLLEIPTSARDRINAVVETTPTPLTIAQRQASYLQDLNTRLKDFKLPPPAVLVDFETINKSNGRSFLQFFYLSERQIDEDGVSTLKQVVRNQVKLPNLGLILTRIDSDVKTIQFGRNTAKINEESLNFLIEVVEEMQNHPSLRLRISLKKEEDKSELRAKREEALNEFFIQKNSINEARLIFGDAEEEDSSDTLQFFDRK